MHSIKTFSAVALFVMLLFGCQTSTGNPATHKKKVAKTGDAPKFEEALKEEKGVDGTLAMDSTTFKRHIKNLRLFASINGYSTQYAMVIDLAIHSGSKRFFMVRLSDAKIIQAGLVTHGSSPTSLQNGERAYSNANGSLCSSLGKYKIGNHYQGTYGLAYKLFGLDKTNSNAFARAVVLHSHSCVPDTNTEEPICQSWGCPTVSPSFLHTIATFIDKSPKPILMDIYDSTKD